MKPAERIQKLEPLIGCWETIITMIEDGREMPEVSHAKDTYSWSANGMFVQHEVDGNVGGARQKSLEIIGADPEEEGFLSRSYDPDGTYSDYRCWFEGERWKIEGRSIRFEGRLSDKATSLSGIWQRVSEDNEWEDFMSITMTKV